ncbi:hypothetical protein A2997_00860 [Candidatus Nomurabacteria bacterium RIFCSPLOWO2_01_FULL_36_10b]|uniref:Uncharacterized protein n=1 Tax=Candidatus Nomurabacteria bacterium RIFCSPLOWO2_01_FULL_36_10b TaxID=1801766 RepID=A0A1F6WQ87_9BACT|nr:MAG: hypothetical protein A2997_00860 [Candidatus Nomurabacteria bacterium RIFCSPLOWO2_01_FULL_36_10b]
MDKLNDTSKEIWKGTEFWSGEIEKAGVIGKLCFFNDVIVEKIPPHPESGYNLVLSDTTLDGKKCDIYHTDQDESGNKIKGRSYHRIFIYTKDVE